MAANGSRSPRHRSASVTSYSCRRQSATRTGCALSRARARTRMRFRRRLPRSPCRRSRSLPPSGRREMRPPTTTRPSHTSYTKRTKWCTSTATGAKTGQLSRAASRRSAKACLCSTSARTPIPTFPGRQPSNCPRPRDLNATGRTTSALRPATPRASSSSPRKRSLSLTRKRLRAPSSTAHHGRTAMWPRSTSRRLSASSTLRKCSLSRCTRAWRTM